MTQYIETVLNIVGSLKDPELRACNIRIEQVEFPMTLKPANYLDIGNALAKKYEIEVYHYNQFSLFLERISPNGKQGIDNAVFVGPVKPEKPYVDFIIDVSQGENIRDILTFLGFRNEAIDKIIDAVGSLDTQRLMIDISTFDNGAPYLAIIPHEVFIAEANNNNGKLAYQILVFEAQSKGGVN